MIGQHVSLYPGLRTGAFTRGGEGRMAMLHPGGIRNGPVLGACPVMLAVAFTSGVAGAAAVGPLEKTETRYQGWATQATFPELAKDLGFVAPRQLLRKVTLTRISCVGRWLRPPDVNLCQRSNA
jgi:hypothetical protein